jgi:hypothetical protein
LGYNDRKIKLIVLCLVFSIFTSAATLRFVWTDDTTAGASRWLGIFCGFILLLSIVALIIALITYVVKSLLAEWRPSAETNSESAVRPPGFPVVTVIPDYAPPIDGPGHYHIEGVDRNTKNDITRDIHADSLANAKVKAELDGIIVTSVTKTA